MGITYNKHVHTDEQIIESLYQAMIVFGVNISKRQYDLWPDKLISGRVIAKRIGWQKAKDMAAQMFTDNSMSVVKDEEGHRAVVKEPEKKNYKEWIQFANYIKQQFEKESQTIEQTAIKKFKEGPIVVVFSSDWHLGSLATNYEEFERNIDFILNTPNVYMVIIGDTIDNFLQFPDKSALLSQIMNPRYQKYMLKSILDELLRKNKILAVGWGDHDSRFEEKLSGSDVIQELTANSVPYFAGKGVLCIEVGKQRYSCSVMHRSRFNSSINETHGSSQEYRFFVPADINVTAHQHSPAYTVCYRMPVAREAGLGCGGQVILIRTGSYKEKDIYSLRGWNKGQIGTPAVICYSDEWKLIPFSTPELAVEFIK